MAAPRKYPPELQERALRCGAPSSRASRSPTSPTSLASTPRGCGPGSARTGPTGGERSDRPTTAEQEELRRLRKEVTELRRANEILRAVIAYFAGELDPTRRRS